MKKYLIGQSGREDELTVVKIRFLLFLSESNDKDTTITRIATIFGVAKSTVSRIAGWCEKNRLIMRTEKRGIEFTDYGKRICGELKAKREVLKKWLILQGIESRVAEGDSINILNSLSNESFKKIENHVKKNEVREKYSKFKTLGGSEFCNLLDDGSYEITFTVYKYDINSSKALLPSMANEGLEETGELVIKNNEGIIVLRARSISHMSALKGLIVDGQLNSLKYYDKGEFKDSVREGDTFYFPARALTFINIGNNYILQGSAILRVSCSLGKLHMPESSCIFTIFF